MKDLIATIAKALVDQPERVSVAEIQGSHNSVLELKVAKSDMGKVIGKRDRTAQAKRRYQRFTPKISLSYSYDNIQLSIPVRSPIMPPGS